MFWHDDHFQVFAQSLEIAVSKYDESRPQPGVDADFLLLQKNQVESLVSLEEQWKQTLIAHAWGPKVYRQFVEFIREEVGNILSARPYFRERQTHFVQFISPALRNKDPEALYPHRINASFILWALKEMPWKPKSPVVTIADQIFKLRNELVEMNMPLAISRARIFGARAPKNHLSQMDLVQLAAEGLLVAIDKFVPPFSRVFRSVAIGRMVSYFIQAHSHSLIHFYPSDVRKIYRARKIMSSAGDIDGAELAERVNSGVDTAGGRGRKTSPEELSQLLAGADVSSTFWYAIDEGEEALPGDRFSAPPESQPDVTYEEAEAYCAMYSAISKLTIFEQKLLRLRGVSL